MQIETVNIDNLTPYEKNAKLHPRDQIEQIKKSIEMYGNNDPIAVWGEKNIIVEGHGRYTALHELGYKTVDIIRLDHLTDEQRREYMLVHNQTTMNSGWDIDLLAGELEDLDFGGFDFGFDLDLDDLFEDEKEIEEDDVPEKAETRCKLGDLWQLGRHRLICGDSTDVAVIDRLMDGVKADCVFTDPPYGVSYTDKNEFLNSIDKPICVVNAIENDSKTPEEMYEFWIKAFTVLVEHSADKMSYYITAPQGGDLLLLLQAVRDSGFALKHVLVWNKNNHVLGRCDYNYKHEPIVYGWKQNGTHNFYGAGEMKTSVWDVPRPQRSDLHLTMKPIELIANALLNSTKKGDAVIDTFGGSGSTLIACEQLNRRCYMCELDEHYCDVIIQRWENLTGKKATRIKSAREE